MVLALAQFFTRGALTLHTVVAAIALRGTGGRAWVSSLTAAIGAAADLGALASSLLVGTQRLGA